MAPLSLSSWRRLVNLRAKDRALASVPGGAPGTTAVTFNTDVITPRVGFTDKFPEINSQTKLRLAIRSAKCADSSTSKITGCTPARRTPSPPGSHDIESSSPNFKATSHVGGPLISAIPPPIPVGGVIEYVQGNDTVSPIATITLIGGGPSSGQGNSSSTTVLSSTVSRPVITLSTGAPAAAGAGNGQIPSKVSTWGGPSSTTSLVNAQTRVSGGSIQLTSSASVSLTLSTDDRGAIPNVTGSPTATEDAVRVIDGTATDGGASEVSFTTTTTSNSDVASGTPTPLTTQSTQIISISSPAPTTGTQVVPGVSASGGSESESSTKTDALIGGCIGAAVLVLGVSILLFLHFRRRRRNEEKRETFITATPYPFPVEASYSPSTGSPPSSASKLITMHADLPTMPRPTFLGVDTPVVSENPPARTPLGRKHPVPFLDHPVLNQRMGGPTSSSPASLQVIVHQHTMMAEDPLGDPGGNMSDDPLPAVQVVGGTRRLKKHRSIASFFPSQSTVREHGVAL